MRSFLAFAAAFSLALVSAGCGGDTSAAKKVEEAKVKISEAGTATWEAAKAKRDEFIAVMSKQMNELDVKYEELKVQAAASAPEAKKNMEKLLEEAKTKKDEAAVKLEELKTAGADRWEKVKDATGKAFDELKNAFK